jgi:hypothetical protein
MNNKIHIRRRITVAAAAAAIALCALLPVHSGAEEIIGGIYNVNDTSFALAPGAEYTLGIDDGSMDIPGGPPVNGDFYSALEQNGDLWYAVEYVKVRFRVAVEGDPNVIYLQGVMQLGDMSGWAWSDSDNQPEFVSLTSVDGRLNGAFEVIYYPRYFMEMSGTYKDEQGGVNLMGLKFGNSGGSPANLTITFEDVTICGDTEKMLSYGSEIGVVIESGAPQETRNDEYPEDGYTPPETEADKTDVDKTEVDKTDIVTTYTEPAQSDLPAETGGIAETSPPPANPKTAAGDWMKFAGWALVSAGIMAICHKKTKHKCKKRKK